MSLLLPLGLLGLISIGVLILIYIIKPNYQQKFVSSTYIWKLSLKYKKKSLPINRIRNILILLCQILILVSCAMLLARPVLGGDKNHDSSENIVIIDASASMRVVNGSDETRFERALSRVREFAEDTARKNGVLTVIVAGRDAEVLAQRVNTDNMSVLYDALDELLQIGKDGCSYGAADIDGAFTFAGEVLNENPAANVILYTATEYLEHKDVKIVNVSEDGEWNAAILDCKASYVDNFFDITVDVGCYGRSENVTVICDVYNPNNTGAENSVRMTKSEYFSAAQEEISFVFGAEDQMNAGSKRIYSFDYIHVSIDSYDSLENDNAYFLYGGNKENIKIQYSTSDNENPFFRKALYTLRSEMQNQWSVEVSEVKPADAKTEGFDLYIFEHQMPKEMPKDGVSFLVNPDSAPAGSGLTLGRTQTVDRLSSLAPGESHPVTRAVNPGNITVSGYRQVTSSEGYKELMYLSGDPILLVKDTPTQKTLVFAGDIHRSNVAILIEFPLIIKNLYDYFIPFTFRNAATGTADYSYHVDDAVSLRSRDTSLLMSFDDLNGYVYEEEFTEFPASVTLSTPGLYTFTQDSLRVKGITERIFVSISADESNITKQVNSLPSLERLNRKENEYKDLLLIFASVLVALLFVEWFLQSREYFK